MQTFRSQYHKKIAQVSRTHIEHPIGFVQNQVLDIGQIGFAHFQ